MSERFPLYQEWVDLQARSHSGVLTIALVVLIAVLWLAYCRAWWPTWLPRARILLLCTFYATWIVAFIIGAFNR